MEAWRDIDVDHFFKLLGFHPVCFQRAGEVGYIALENGLCELWGWGEVLSVVGHDFHVEVNNRSALWHESVTESTQAFTNVPDCPHADESEDGIY